MSLLCLSKSECDDFLNEIPEGLSIGSAGAAYQIEGAWNVSGEKILTISSKLIILINTFMRINKSE